MHVSFRFRLTYKHESLCSITIHSNRIWKRSISFEKKFSEVFLHLLRASLLSIGTRKIGDLEKNLNSQLLKKKGSHCCTVEFTRDDRFLKDRDSLALECQTPASS